MEKKKQKWYDSDWFVVGSTFVILVITILLNVMRH